MTWASEFSDRKVCSGPNMTHEEEEEESCGGTSYDYSDDEDYDPYEEEEEPVCSGSGGGSGTQFQPGDFTNGETVDFATGVGNGGGSVCGPAAYVDYICIDIYYEDDGWTEYTCGYATVC